MASNVFPESSTCCSACSCSSEEQSGQQQQPPARVPRSRHRFLMCPPKHFAVRYVINSWMRLDAQPDATLARQQWDDLRATIEKCGAEVVTIEPAADLPDQVFSANCGLVRGRSVYLSSYAHSERRPERAHYERWFREHGFRVAGFEGGQGANEGLAFEGTGDALFAGTTLVGGHGFRTSPAVYTHVLEHLNAVPPDEEACGAGRGPVHLVSVELVDKRFYHLDTCFCPITPNLALWYPEAFSEASRRRLAGAMELIEVSQREALAFACNSFPVDNHVILPDRCPITCSALERRGFTPLVCPMSEFMKSGGAGRCLVLDIGNPLLL